MSHSESTKDDTSSSRSHVIHEWVAVRVNVTCHIYSRRDDMSRFNESCNTWVGRDTFKCDMLHIYIDSESTRWHVIIQWVMSHTWMSHVTQQHTASQPIVHEMTRYHSMSHVTYTWVMSHMNESCHIWMRHVTYDSESTRWHVIIQWVMSHMSGSWYVKKRHFWQARSRFVGVADKKSKVMFGRHTHTRARWHVIFLWAMSHMWGPVVCE